MSAAAIGAAAGGALLLLLVLVLVDRRLGVLLYRRRKQQAAARRGRFWRFWRVRSRLPTSAPATSATSAAASEKCQDNSASGACKIDSAAGGNPTALRLNQAGDARKDFKEDVRASNAHEPEAPPSMRGARAAAGSAGWAAAKSQLPALTAAQRKQSVIESFAGAMALPVA